MTADIGDSKGFWASGPSLHIHKGGEEKDVTYYIPSGCKFLEYRYKKHDVHNASVTVQYVEANSKSEIQQSRDKEQNARNSAKFGVAVTNISPSASIEATLSKERKKRKNKGHSAAYSHSAIVVEAETSKGSLVAYAGKVDVDIEIRLLRESYPYGYMINAGFLVLLLMVTWISGTRRPWYKKVFSEIVRLVSRNAQKVAEGLNYLLLEEIIESLSDLLRIS